jgi:hypothetical protein
MAIGRDAACGQMTIQVQNGKINVEEDAFSLFDASFQTVRMKVYESGHHQLALGVDFLAFPGTDRLITYSFDFSIFYMYGSLLV